MPRRRESTPAVELVPELVDLADAVKPLIRGEAHEGRDLVTVPGAGTLRVDYDAIAPALVRRWGVNEAQAAVLAKRIVGHVRQMRRIARRTEKDGLRGLYGINYIG